MQDAQNAEITRLEKAVTQLEQIVSRRQNGYTQEQIAHETLKHRHALLRARTQAAIDGIDQILGEER